MNLRAHPSNEYNHESSDLTKTTLHEYKKSLASNLGSKEQGLTQESKKDILANLQSAEKTPTFFTIDGHEITDTRTEQEQKEAKVVPFNAEETQEEAKKVMQGHYLKAA